MSEWSWVAFGYSVTFGSMAAYVTYLVIRTSRARRRLAELE